MQPFERLEFEFGNWVNCSHMVACSSGTAALHLALESMCIPRGSQVLVPEFTMIACARAVSLAGLVPVFVDCGDDLLMDCRQLSSLVTERTTAIMPVHIYGRCCDMETIRSFAYGHGLCVIEDCAEVHGARLGEFNNGHSGSRARCWSFYRNKIVAGEEGGAVAFAHHQRADTARKLRNMGFTDDHDFLHLERGHNYRMSNAHAELILRSLEQAEDHLTQRRAIEEQYDLLVPQEWHMPPRDVVWVYDLKLPKDFGAAKVVRDLNRLGISARQSFKPMSQQPEYRGHYTHLKAYEMSRRVIYLPVVPGETDVRANVEAMLDILKTG